MVYCEDESTGNCCFPKKESNRAAVIAGAVVGSVLGALLLAFLAFIIYIRCIKYSKKSNVVEEDVRHKIDDSGKPKGKEYNIKIMNFLLT